jgi:hypothetical protein
MPENIDKDTYLQLENYEKFMECSRKMTKTKLVCPICDKLISSTHMHKHIKACVRKHNERIDRKKIAEEKTYICKFCGSKWPKKTSLGGHIISCRRNPKSEEHRKNVSVYRSGKLHTDAAKRRIAETQKKNHAEKLDDQIKNPLKGETVPIKLLDGTALIFRDEDEW